VTFVLLLVTKLSNNRPRSNIVSSEKNIFLSYKCPDYSILHLSVNRSLYLTIPFSLFELYVKKCFVLKYTKNMSWNHQIICSFWKSVLVCSVWFFMTKTNTKWKSQSIASKRYCRFQVSLAKVLKKVTNSSVRENCILIFLRTPNQLVFENISSDTEYITKIVENVSRKTQSLCTNVLQNISFLKEIHYQLLFENIPSVRIL
jgi:hypothetical protein